jgi:ABC-type molybdate transport system permease subunit
MPTPTSLSFKWNGLAGVLLALTGIACSVIFRNARPWPAETKQLMYPVALVMAVSGCMLLGSFVQRRPLHTMRAELTASAFMLLILALTKP